MRDSGLDWTKETPLGGMGTSLNACVLYSLIRQFSMKNVVETGVSGGYYSAFMLAALKINYGLLTSLEISDNENEVGKMVPTNLKKGWALKMGKSSLDRFKEIGPHSAQLYSHDSLHTMAHMTKELKEFQKSQSDKFFVFIDDEKSDNFWNRCLQMKAFMIKGCDVKYVSGQESRLHGHLGGFIQYKRT